MPSTRTDEKIEDFVDTGEFRIAKPGEFHRGNDYPDFVFSAKSTGSSGPRKILRRKNLFPDMPSQVMVDSPPQFIYEYDT